MKFSITGTVSWPFHSRVCKYLSILLEPLQYCLFLDTCTAYDYAVPEINKKLTIKSVPASPRIVASPRLKNVRSYGSYKHTRSPYSPELTEIIKVRLYQRVTELCHMLSPVFCCRCTKMAGLLGLCRMQVSPSATPTQLST